VPGRCCSLCGNPFPGVPPRPLWAAAMLYSPNFACVAFSEVELPFYGVLGSCARTTTEGDEAHEKGRGILVPALEVAFSKALALGVVGPYLAVDLLDEGIAVLMVFLELAHLPQLLGREALDPLGDLLHGQPFVVGGLQRSQHGGP
jgi:hypothetical protein